VDSVEVDGLVVAFERRGHGPGLVLLHGWPSNRREWRRQIDALSDDFTVVAWDAPGAGGSSDPPESFRLADWANCLVGLIDALELQRPHVAGLSWGGGLALELYRSHPSVPRSLILASAYAGWSGSLPPHVVDQRLALMLKNCELPSDDWAPAWIQTLLSAHASREMAAELRVIASEIHPAGTRVAMRAFAEADLREVLPRIDVPTLLLYGDADVRAPRDVWEPLLAEIPAATLVRFPGVGHMIDIEAGDRFNEEVRSFLRSQGA
jgi:pimeloyl-ACP methyl ester carboxylesterase